MVCVTYVDGGSGSVGRVRCEDGGATAAAELSRVKSIFIPFDSGSWGCYPVSGLVRTADKLGQESIIFDDTDRAFGEKEPKVRLFGAAAAVAPDGRLDFMCLDLEDVAAAMAVTSICLEVFRGRHDVTDEFRNKSSDSRIFGQTTDGDRGCMDSLQRQFIDIYTLL